MTSPQSIDDTVDVPLTDNAALLWTALTAAVVAVVLGVVVVVRRARADVVAPTGRVRFPARALERGVFVGAFAVCAGAVSSVDVAGDVMVGVAAVVVAAGWMLWRGTGLSLSTNAIGQRRG